MPPSPLFQKLQAIAGDFTCGVWGSPEVLSPQRHVEKAEREYNLQPNQVTASRLAQARGKWAVVFRRPPVGNARRGPDSTAPLEASAAFTPQEVKEMEASAIRKVMIGIIIEREVHEVLEWSQLRSAPGVPVIDPHRNSDDLAEVIYRALTAILDHAT